VLHTLLALTSAIRACRTAPGRGVLLDISTDHDSVHGCVVSLTAFWVLVGLVSANTAQHVLKKMFSGAKESNTQSIELLVSGASYKVKFKTMASPSSLLSTASSLLSTSAGCKLAKEFGVP